MIVNMQIENEYQQAIQVLHWTKWNSFNFFELNPFLYYSTYEEKLFHFVSMVQYGAIMLSENLLIIGTFLFYKQHKALAMGKKGFFFHGVTFDWCRFCTFFNLAQLASWAEFKNVQNPWKEKPFNRQRQTLGIG